MSVSNTTLQNGEANPPWWRLPIVWLVIAGPLAVVVASLFTVGIAVRNVDPVLDTSAGKAQSPEQLPAISGRNKAAEISSREPADK